MTQTKQKIHLTILLILIFILGISIIALCFYSKNGELPDERIVKSRIIFKENGITFTDLYANHKKQINADTAKTLNKLNILSNDISFLDGLPLDLDGKEKIPFAVMIENYPDVREYTVGLDKAKIVYEALVEGGFTRYLAVFDPNGVSKIGPVRSARPYFIHWAEEFGGVYVHIGGSHEALAYLRNSSGVINIDENEGEDVIEREDKHLAPHNAFTSTKKLSEKVMNYNWKKQIQENFFKFKLKEYPTENPIREIVIDFSISIYNVKWVYNEKNNTYERYIAGLKQEGLEAKNIIIQILPNILIEGDEKGRLEMSVLGSGKAFYFVDGEMLEGTWHKSDYSEKTFFLDSENNEIALNKGQTWIEVVDYEQKISTK